MSLEQVTCVHVPGGDVHTQIGVSCCSENRDSVATLGSDKTAPCLQKARHTRGPELTRMAGARAPGGRVRGRLADPVKGICTSRCFRFNADSFVLLRTSGAP